MKRLGGFSCVVSMAAFVLASAVACSCSDEGCMPVTCDVSEPECARLAGCSAEDVAACDGNSECLRACVEATCSEDVADSETEK